MILLRVPSLLFLFCTLCALAILLPNPAHSLFPVIPSKHAFRYIVQRNKLIKQRTAEIILQPPSVAVETTEPGAVSGDADNKSTPELAAAAAAAVAPSASSSTSPSPSPSSLSPSSPSASCCDKTAPLDGAAPLSPSPTALKTAADAKASPSGPTAATEPQPLNREPSLTRAEHVALLKDKIYHWQTLNFTQILDHFNFNQSTHVFQQKYLLAKQFWHHPNAGDDHWGPIFFYCGNEGPIDLFANNTGFLWEAAAEMGAMVVFAEHRYYGQTMPFGDHTFEVDNLQYLTSEQALADYALLIPDIKRWNNMPLDVPVIAFGGSYGGMLAAWFRFKYPHVITGSIAASAPVVQFSGLTDPGAFYRVVTADFEAASPVCATSISKGWDIMKKWGQTEEGRQELAQKFRLCAPLNHSSIEDALFPWVQTALTYLPMADYPYEASFLGLLPANPVNVACSYFSEHRQTESDILDSLHQATGLFYNYSGDITSPCFVFGDDEPSTLADAGGWPYQACTEMVMPTATYGSPNDMFWFSPWNISLYKQMCIENYNIVPRENWMRDTFGGWNITAHSNIVFSNGDLDPWSTGGIDHNLTDSLISILIKGGAHHLDIRASNPADPQSVIDARETEKAFIAAWVDGKHTPYPASDPVCPPPPSASHTIPVVISVAATLVASILAFWVALHLGVISKGTPPKSERSPLLAGPNRSYS